MLPSVVMVVALMNSDSSILPSCGHTLVDMIVSKTIFYWKITQSTTMCHLQSSHLILLVCYECNFCLIPRLFTVRLQHSYNKGMYANNQISDDTTLERGFNIQLQ